MIATYFGAGETRTKTDSWPNVYVARLTRLRVYFRSVVSVNGGKENWHQPSTSEQLTMQLLTPPPFVNFPKTIRVVSLGHYPDGFREAQVILTCGYRAKCVTPGCGNVGCAIVRYTYAGGRPMRKSEFCPMCTPTVARAAEVRVSDDRLVAS
jgi:hypothetical protein